MIESELCEGLHSYWRQRHRIPGLFEDIDVLLFDRLQHLQLDGGVGGDLLEIGAFMGKGAIVLGTHATGGQRMIVNDVFGDDAAEVANSRENRTSYQGLTRSKFEENYHRYVAAPPTVVQDLSENLRTHVPDGTIRFAHVDGGHLFSVVSTDLTNVRHLLTDGGIVAFDDFRAFHTPGVAAAVWGAVAHDGLIPICLTETKMYGSWDAAAAGETAAALRGWLNLHPEVRHGTQRIGDLDVLLVENPKIWTRRRRIKAMLPPVIAERLQPIPKPHLGE